ncbi:MAG: nickel insertion protein, partial [Coprobacillus sp.]
MKALYFECHSGISGNMTLGALSELVGDPQYLIDQLNHLHIDGYRIEVSKQVKNGITGTYVDVILEHHHHHDH